jgi:hypothetical protein
LFTLKGAKTITVVEEKVSTIISRSSGYLLEGWRYGYILGFVTATLHLAQFYETTLTPGDLCHAEKGKTITVVKQKV